jgi:cytochrome b involved in lipid metabolism
MTPEEFNKKVSEGK